MKKKQQNFQVPSQKNKQLLEEYENTKISHTPLYRILEIYNLQKYAKNLSKKQINTLLTKINTQFQDKNKLEDILKYLNDLFPSLEQLEELRVSQSTQNFLNIAHQKYNEQKKMKINQNELNRQKLTKLISKQQSLQILQKNEKSFLTAYSTNQKAQRNQFSNSKKQLAHYQQFKTQSKLSKDQQESVNKLSIPKSSFKKAQRPYSAYINGKAKNAIKQNNKQSNQSQQKFEKHYSTKSLQQKQQEQNIDIEPKFSIKRLGFDFFDQESSGDEDENKYLTKVDHILNTYSKKMQNSPFSQKSSNQLKQQEIVPIEKPNSFLNKYSTDIYTNDKISNESNSTQLNMRYQNSIQQCIKPPLIASKQNKNLINICKNISLQEKIMRKKSFEQIIQTNFEKYQDKVIFYEKLNLHVDLIKSLYKSFDNGKMSSTIVNLDLEEMDFCLGCVIMKHIDFYKTLNKSQLLESLSNLNAKSFKDEQFNDSQSFFESQVIKEEENQNQLSNKKYTYKLQNTPFKQQEVKNENEEFEEFDGIESFNKSVQQTGINNQLEESDDISEDVADTYQSQDELAVISEHSTLEEHSHVIQQKQNKEHIIDIDTDCIKKNKIQDILRESIQIIQKKKQKEELRQSQILPFKEKEQNKILASLKQPFNESQVVFAKKLQENLLKEFKCNFNQKIEQQYYGIKIDKMVIKNYVKNIMTTCKMEKEVSIICLVYIERLLVKGGIFINEENWKRIVFISLVISSKIWDDESFENDNFAKVFPQFKFTTKQINTMEHLFLKMIDYDLIISPSEYAKYYFILRGFAEKNQRSFPLQLLDLKTVINLQKKTLIDNVVKKSSIKLLHNSF